MLNEKIIEKVLGAALSSNGDFAEIFVEKKENNFISMSNNIIDKTVSGIDSGVGIRIFYNDSAIYTYTNDFSENNLIKIAKEAADSLVGDKKATQKVINKCENENVHKIKKFPTNGDKSCIADIMHTACKSAKKFDNKISQTESTYANYTQDVLIANSEGLHIKDKRTRTRFSLKAIASNDFEKQSGTVSPGGHVGIELFDDLNVSDLGEQVAKTAITMLNADFCPSGKMPVVIDNGFGGVIFHEACGHGLEATSVAKKASVFYDKMGEKIASNVVTAIDDGTILNGWGSSNIDDEGHKTQKNILIENGILKSFLIDKLNGKKMNMSSTGSGRRESYKYAPTSRMTNTYIANGTSSKEDIISSIDYGLYAKQMGGGSVDPATGVFNFSVLEGYIIRNGKICEAVRGATLIGKGSEILFKIDMVSDNLKTAQGMCGSISGSIPTDVGQPTIKVSEITVGGRKGV